MNSTLLIQSLLWSLILYGSAIGKETVHYPYQDRSLAVEERVEDLLERMSLAEKVRQMDMVNADLFAQGDAFLADQAGSHLGTLGAGSMHVRGFQADTAKLCNTAQRYVIEHSRWGIPVLFLEEALHGAYTKDSTLFPIPLGLASTWNPDLIESVGRVIATESRAHGIAMGLGPVLGLAREPRWGRVEETYGEDPYLVGEIGLAMIRGWQGMDLTSDRSILAEPKHFAVHSQPLAGANCMPVFTGEREARSSFLVPFEKAFRQGHARAAMSAYSEWNGVPCTANSWLLTDLLRDEWGFQGFVLSDLGAISQLQTQHYIADSPKDAMRQAVAAGVDMQFYDFDNDVYQNTLIELVEQGQLPLAAIDRAVSDILRVKFELGLFERSYVDEALVRQRNHCQGHQEIALRAAQESICLLKNKDKLLPLQNVKTIAVLGPNADDKALTGGYAREHAEVMTVVDGFKRTVGSDVKILHEAGIPIVMKGVAVPSEYLWLPDLSGPGLKGEYFDNPDLSGEPVLTRQDEGINFHWGEDAPVKELGKDQFSIRWTGTLIPKEDFTGWLGTSSDDGSRLYIDDQWVVDHWAGSTLISQHAMTFKANQKYKITLEYRDTGWDAHVSLRWDYQAYGIERAKELATQADVAVVVVGENSSIVGENKDRASLDLYGEQLQFVQEIHATGTPVVVVLLNGRPISIPWITENIPAILETWFPGEAGGLAIAQVLLGSVNPAGRLPMTIPYSVGQCPIYYNQKAWSHRRNVDHTDQPLYAFGHGLSYSTFAYSHLELSATELTAKDELVVSFDVKNQGPWDGDEVVQLYVNDVISSVTTPHVELKAFKRIHIKSGQSTSVQLKLLMSELALWTRDMQRVVEPGEFEILVESSSQDIRLRSAITVRE